MELFEFGEYWDIYTYLFILLIGLIICALTKKGVISQTRKKVNVLSNQFDINIWFILLFLLFVFLYTFKDVSFGADSDFYVKNFQSSTSFYTEYNTELEPLFNLFTYLIRKLSDNYTVYFLFASLIVASGYVNFIKTFWLNDCELLFIVLIAQQFFYDMNIMRSGIGGAFLLHSFCCLRHKKLSTAIFFTIIAACFQFTLIVNLPFIACNILLSNRNKLSKTKTILLFLLLAATTFGVTYFSQLLIVSTRYVAYFTKINPTIIGNWNIILSAILAIIILSKRKITDKRVEVAIISSLFSAILIVPVMLLGAYRLPFYFYMPRIFLWGYVLKNQNIVTLNPFLKKCLALFIVIFYSLFVLSRRSSDYGFAYKFIELFSK